MLRNTNHLIGHFDGCDGLKTGFTFHAGFNLTATAKRGDLRLIAVVLGAPSNPGRFREAGRLLEWGFDNFTVVTDGQEGGNPAGARSGRLRIGDPTGGRRRPSSGSAQA